MCRFKSGIILKTRCVIAQGSDDSHTRLLEELKIEDSELNAMSKFVRAELIPPNGEWWTHPDTWEINIDQDITPDWFNDDKTRYIEEFKQAVIAWWEKHVLIDKVIDELSSGYYRLKRCEVKRLCKDVRVMCDSSTVQVMCDSSTVQRMYSSSTVQDMYDSSTVQVMCDSSTVQRMYGSSTVQRMCDSSTVQDMCNSSTVQVMCDSSTVQRMYSSSTVQRMYGGSTVQRMCNSSIARDYTNGILRVSSNTSLKVQKHVNK